MIANNISPKIVDLEFLFDSGITHIIMIPIYKAQIMG